MTQHNKVLIEHSLEKAVNALDDACTNIDISLSVAQNRAYYAVFYTVLALSYLDGYTTGKHHQLMGWFNKKYVYQEKVFDSSYAKIYNTLMINREKSDYDVTQIPVKEAVEKDIKSAKVFVETISIYIQSRLNSHDKL